jgi:hypothetical protein
MKRYLGWDQAAGVDLTLLMNDTPDHVQRGSIVVIEFIIGGNVSEKRDVMIDIGERYEWE